MIMNPENITNVTKHENEYIFCYKGKYIWRILEPESPSNYDLYFYPDAETTSECQQLMEWPNVNFVRYNSKEIGTPEAKSSMAELATIVREKLFGMDEVIDDIISDALL